MLASRIDVRWFLDQHGVLGTLTFMALVPVAIYASAKVGGLFFRVSRARIGEVAVKAFATSLLGAFIGSVVYCVSSLNLGHESEQGVIWVGCGGLRGMGTDRLRNPSRRRLRSAAPRGTSPERGARRGSPGSSVSRHSPPKKVHGRKYIRLNAAEKLSPDSAP